VVLAKSRQAGDEFAVRTPDPLVVSIVVNYRGRDETQACLDSLLAVDYPRHEVVVVDNDSGPQEVAALREEFGTRVHIIESTQNLGYGGAANLGLKWAIARPAEYAWVLNNDTLADRRSVRALVEAMEREPAYGAASPVIESPIGPDSPKGIWYAGGSANAARASTVHLHEPIEAADGIVPTGFVTGCAMFLRSSALVQAGLFWPQLFLYWEDVDLSYRLSVAGWKLGVVPSARLHHLGHGSVQSEVASYFFYRNALLVARRQGHARGAARAVVTLSSRAGRRWVACALKGYRPFPIAETRGLLAGIAANLWGWPAARRSMR
jgi:GT2 family glycosyltransferase